MEQFESYLRLRILCADMERLLNDLTLSGVELHQLTFLDAVTAEVTIRNHSVRSVEKIFHKYGADYSVIQQVGIFWRVREIFKRPVLIAGLFLFLLFTCLLPRRILFVDIVGNISISDVEILRAAESCGIAFGAKSSDVRSEVVKNQLLSMLEDLQWVGVTTNGTVVTIRVRERTDTPKAATEGKGGISNIVATRDGVITRMTVQRGNPLCSMGQTVKSGDVLVSGYTDCGIMVKAEQAEAEIFALTLHQKTVVTTNEVRKRLESTGKHTCYQLVVGKKVINLCNHSRIMDTSCVKMYSEDFLTLPGGFSLPVALVRVDHYEYTTAEYNAAEEDAPLWILEFARDYLLAQMAAGEILAQDYQWLIDSGKVTLLGTYACHELIGQVKFEEIIG